MNASEPNESPESVVKFDHHLLGEPGFAVFVDDNFHYGDENERYCLGRFSTYEEAVMSCKKIVDESLLADHTPGMSAAELSQRYKMFGEDPWIANANESQSFSAWDYAERRAKEICKP